MTIGDPEKVPLEYLMLTIGEQGHHVVVRFDPLRTERKFTIIIDGSRLTDTDSPQRELADYWRERYARTL